MAVALLGPLGACGPPDPGQVRFRLTSTPPPDDKVLSPLLDPRLTSLELRSRDVVLARARFDRVELAANEGVGAPTVELGPLPVGDPRDMQLLALGAAGQQVLGLAVTRDVEVRFGEQREYVFELRRPLFFFGSGRRLVSPMPFPPSDRSLSPGRRIADALREEHLLRVVDPNSGTPLLSAYHLALDGMRQALASAATSDGLSVLVVTEGGTLHLLETLRLKPALSLKLPTEMPAQAVVVSPRDELAAILHHETSPPQTGLVGRITLLRDLPGLRSRVSRDGDPLVVEIRSDMQSPVGAPLAAAYGPDGLLDVVLGQPPMAGGDTCTPMDGGRRGTLRRYDPRSGQLREQVPIAYSTGVAYTNDGTLVLAQPCTKAPSGKRPGQILFQRWMNGSLVPVRALPAPGSADISLAAGKQALIAIGRDDTSDDPDGTVQARGVVRTLEPGQADWSQQSPFPLDDWLLPYRVTITGGGTPLPASVEIVLAPRDLLVYRIVTTPDRTRALIAARVTHQVEGMFLDRITMNGREHLCFIDWLGYTYHVMLVNLQTGAREQGWMVGVQNQSCSSVLWERIERKAVGVCFSECQYAEGGMLKNGRLRGYQEGFIPTGTSALFSGQ